MSSGKDKKIELKKAAYERRKMCPDCKTAMEYMYGEEFKCPACGRMEKSDFGKVKEYLEENGPQPAIIINQNTGVSLEYINELLRQGRIEVPDGSEIYIKCQSCGTDIRYGRYCPECTVKMSKLLSGAIWSTDMGEKPRNKKSDGEMHYLKRIKRK